MKEIEVRILNIDVDETIRKLKFLGAQKEGEYEYRRIVYSKTIKKSPLREWIRLRNDGKKTTLAYKKVDDGVEEIEIDVGDFDTAKRLLNQILFKRCYQENRRIRYILDGIEFDIDFWPELEPYIEVEASTEEDLRRGVKLLGYSMADSTQETNQELYAKIGIDLNKIERLVF